MPRNVVRTGFLLTVFKYVEVLDEMVEVIKPSCLLCHSCVPVGSKRFAITRAKLAYP